MKSHHQSQNSVISVPKSLRHSHFHSSKSNSRKSLLLMSSSISNMKNSTTFGAAQRRDPFNTTVCSPAAKYNLKSGIEINLCERKGSSFSASRNDLQKSNFSYQRPNYNPGPGSYHAQLPKSKKKIVIGLKNRKNCQEVFLNQKAISQNPGPGKYTVGKEKKMQGKFPTQGDRFQRDKQNYPGPGYYRPTAYNLSKSKQQNFLAKSNSSSDLQIQKYKFGCSIRKTYFESNSESYCAPGPKYHLHSDFQ